MIYAISTDGRYVSQHFGRCQTYTIVDIENGSVVKKEIVANPGHAPGAIPEFLNKKGAGVVVCGGIGTRAKGIFAQYGIEILAGVDGTVDSVIGKLASGTLSGGESFCTPGAGRGYGIEKTECDHEHEEY